MIQIVEQNREERIVMYMKLSRRELAELIVNCNDIIDSMSKNLVYKVVEKIPVTCDNCGCHPNIINYTSTGRFCEACKPKHF